MLITCTPVVLNKEDLERKLNTKRFLDPNSLLTGGRSVTKMELKYVEYLILDYEIRLGKGLGAFLKGQRQQEVQGIRLIGNGSTGSVSFLETVPSARMMEIPEAMIQRKDYGPNDMKKEAGYLAAMVCRKITGRRCQEIELKNVSSIYRPFWAVYYGQPRKDGKVLCRPYGADGFTIKK